MSHFQDVRSPQIPESVFRYFSAVEHEGFSPQNRLSLANEELFFHLKQEVCLWFIRRSWVKLHAVIVIGSAK